MQRCFFSRFVGRGFLVMTKGMMVQGPSCSYAAWYSSNAVFASELPFSMSKLIPQKWIEKT